MANAHFERQLRNTIEGFVEELSALVRNAALQSVTEAFGGALPQERGRGGASPRTQSFSSPDSKSKGRKRAPEELAALTDRLLDAIKSSPGLRMEQIADGLGRATQELVLPAKKLLAEKKIKTKGERRATKYFPSS